MSRGYVSCISQMRQSSGFAPANIGNPVCPSTKSVRRSLGPSQFHNDPGRRGVIRRITAISLNLRTQLLQDIQMTFEVTKLHLER